MVLLYNIALSPQILQRTIVIESTCFKAAVTERLLAYVVGTRLQKLMVCFASIYSDHLLHGTLAADCRHSTALDTGDQIRDCIVDMVLFNSHSFQTTPKWQWVSIIRLSGYTRLHTMRNVSTTFTSHTMRDMIIARNARP